MILHKVIEHFGSQKAAAAALGISAGHFCKLVSGEKRITAEKARLIEQLTGISRAEIRPDIFA